MSISFSSPVLCCFLLPFLKSTSPFTYLAITVICQLPHPIFYLVHSAGRPVRQWPPLIKCLQEKEVVLCPLPEQKGSCYTHDTNQLLLSPEILMEMTQIHSATLCFQESLNILLMLLFLLSHRVGSDEFLPQDVCVIVEILFPFPKSIP